MPTSGKKRSPAREEASEPLPPLAQYFYDAYLRAGRTYQAIAARAGVSVPTVEAYMKGRRGKGRQLRQRETIERIAVALGLDPAEALRRADLPLGSNLAKHVLNDPVLPRQIKEAVLRIIEPYQPKD